MIKLSLAMIVKNEEGVLDRCLRSVTDIVDEMIVVDTGSTDRTKEIALANGAKVYDFTWCDDFAAARNYSIGQTTGEWVLVLDADEYFTENYSVQINRFMQNRQQIGMIQLTSNVGSNNNVQYSNSLVSRLFTRDIRFTGRIHEQLKSSLPHRIVDDAILQHDGYIERMVKAKTERNTKLLLKALQDDPDNLYYLYQLSKEHFIMENYTDAADHLNKVYSHIDNTYPYYRKALLLYLDVLTRDGNYAEAYRIVNEKGYELQDSPDFHFLSGAFFMNYALDTQDFSVIPNIESSYLKCLELGTSNAVELTQGTSSYLAAYNLGVYYETTGQFPKAEIYYAKAAELQYQPAIQRLQHIRSS